MDIMIWLALLGIVTCATGMDFSLYTSRFGKVYSGESSRARAEKCYERNLQRIAALNSLDGAKHGINQFTDLCPDEFKSVYLNLRYNASKEREYIPKVHPKLASLAANSSVDWRTKGAVTPVKNQGQCGSCWSFGATGNMEGQWFLAGHPLVSLSEQELVSCCKDGGSDGCNGGDEDAAMGWVVNKGGIVSEATYPYVSGGGSTHACNPAKESPIAAKFSSHKSIPKDEQQMAAFVLTSGPLTIAVDASQHWQTYMGGIVKNCNGRELDHAVLIVGFGVEGTTPFWIVKNSWTAGWGESGYIRLERGTNQCGITEDPHTIVV